MNLNIKEACRLCLGKSSKTCDEIFFPIDEDFERKFTEITDCILDVLNEAYPVNICNSCLTQFEEYYNYRKSLIEKQKRLNQLLNIRKDLKIVKKQKLEDLNENKFNVIEYEDEESHSQNEEILETENEYMPAENELNYHEEEEYANQDATNIIDYEEINEHIQPKEEEYVDSDTELQQQECAMYQEEEYVDSESPEYIEMEQIDNDEDRILFAIAAESDVDQIEGECIIVKTEENVSKDGVRKKRKYEKTFIKDRPYKCWQSGCSAAFTHRSSINKHMLLAHNIKCDKNTCMMCGTKFAQYAEFLSHVKTHTRKSECDICKLTFVTDEKMQAHRDRVHKNDSNERNFKCHLCDAMFKRKEHLNSHITYRHTDQSNARRFPCNECSSTFLTRQDLNNHQKSHSQLKKTCTFCDYECRDLKSIKLHYLKVHGTTEIYRCTCEASFELFKDYQLHKKNCYGMINQE